MLVHAAAAAKSLQSCPTLCDSIDGSPPGPIVPGILQARTLEWVCWCIEWHLSKAQYMVVLTIFCGISLPHSPSACTVGRRSLTPPSPSLVLYLKLCPSQSLHHLPKNSPVPSICPLRSWMHLKAIPSANCLGKVLNVIKTSTLKNPKSKAHSWLSLKNSAIPISELSLKVLWRGKKKDKRLKKIFFSSLETMNNGKTR